MTMRRIVPILVLFCSISLLATQVLSRTLILNRSERVSNLVRRPRMTEAERKKKAAENRRQRELELAQRYKELAKEGRGPLISRKQRHENLLKKEDERSKEFFWQKAALVATEEQWKLIKPKLEKVRQLRGQARSTVGLGLTNSSSSDRRNLPTWQWHQPWKGMASSELTDAQKIAKRLIALVENNNTKPEQFRRTMDALRKARKEEDQIKKQLDEARKDLREGLTPRQEAALVLIRWL